MKCICPIHELQHYTTETFLVVVLSVPRKISFDVGIREKRIALKFFFRLRLVHSL